MISALSVLGSVVAVCASCLVAWRWWLAHDLVVAQARITEAQAKVRDLDKEWASLHALSDRLKALEYRTSGR